MTSKFNFIMKFIQSGQTANFPFPKQFKIFFKHFDSACKKKLRAFEERFEDQNGFKVKFVAYLELIITTFRSATETKLK